MKPTEIHSFIADLFIANKHIFAEYKDCGRMCCDDCPFWESIYSINNAKFYRMKRREKKVTNNNNEPWYRNGKETKDKRQGFQTNKQTKQTKQQQ